MDLSDVVSLLDDINLLDAGESVIVTKVKESSYNWQKQQPMVVKKSTGGKKKKAPVTSGRPMPPLKEHATPVTTVEKKAKRYSNPAVANKINQQIYASSSSDEDVIIERNSTKQGLSKHTPQVDLQLLSDSSTEVEEEVIDEFSQQLSYYKN